VGRRWIYSFGLSLQDFHEKTSPNDNRIVFSAPNKQFTNPGGKRMGGDIRYLPSWRIKLRHIINSPRTLLTSHSAAPGSSVWRRGTDGSADARLEIRWTQIEPQGAPIWGGWMDGWDAKWGGSLRGHCIHCRAKRRCGGNYLTSPVRPPHHVLQPQRNSHHQHTTSFISPTPLQDDADRSPELLRAG